MRLKDLDEEARTKKLRSELGLLETSDGAWRSCGRRRQCGFAVPRRMAMNFQTKHERSPMNTEDRTVKEVGVWSC